MLSLWINVGSATVKRLINALEANTVQMNGIAMKLRQKYEKRAQQEGIYPWIYSISNFFKLSLFV